MNIKTECEYKVVLMRAGHSAITIFLNMNSFAFVCIKLLHTANKKICKLGSHLQDKKNDTRNSGREMGQNA